MPNKLLNRNDNDERSFGSPNIDPARESESRSTPISSPNSRRGFYNQPKAGNAASSSYGFGGNKYHSNSTNAGAHNDTGAVSGKNLSQLELGSRLAAGAVSAAARHKDGKDSDRDLADLTRQEEEANKKKRWGRHRRRGFWTDRKIALAGSLFSLGIGGSFFGMTFLAGPLEFVHLAHILQDTHFSEQERVDAERIGKFYRFFATGGNAGETRVSWLESTYHARIVDRLANIGIKPMDTGARYYDGFQIDTANEKSPYKGMTAKEAAAKFEADYKIKPDIHGTRITISANKFFAQKKSINIMLGFLNDSKVTTWVGARVLKKFGLVSMHPLSWADKKLYKTTEPWIKALKEKWSNRFKTGTDGIAQVNTAGATTDAVDEKGNKIPLSAEDQANLSKSATSTAATQEVLEGLSGGQAKALKITGGVAAILGVVCTLKAVNDSVAEVRQLQVAFPLIRMGMDAITVGNQIMSGQDVDLDELSLLSKNMSKVVNGVTESWYDSVQIRSNVGEEGGIDALKTSGVQGLLTEQNIPWLAWTDNAVVKGLCSTAVTVATGVVSIGISIVTGGAATALASAIGGAIVGGPLIHKAGELLAGKAVNPEIGANAGALYGSMVDTGAYMGANTTAVAKGGVQLNAKQTAEIQAENREAQKEEFESKNFFARTFDLMDYRSLSSRLADSMSGKSTLNSVNSLFSTVLSATGSAVSMPFNLYSSKASAATVKPYDQKLPYFQYSLESRNSKLVENPIENAEAAAKILDANPDYVSKALKCFGVEIFKGTEGWDAVAKQTVDIYNTKTYDAADCADSANQDWLRVRFFILDTSDLESYACGNFNDKVSCSNSGFDDGSTDVEASNDNIVSLANAILANKNITLSDSAKADITAMSQGNMVTAGPAAAGSKTKCDPTYLDGDMLHGMIAIAQNYTFTVGTIVSGHACDTSRFPLGRAFEITKAADKTFTWSGDNLAQNKRFAFDAASIMANQMPLGRFIGDPPIPLEMAGVGTCHEDDIPNKPAGVNYYGGYCKSLVLDTGVADV